MGDNYWIKLFSKVMADAYFEFCRRMSSISLAKHSTGTPPVTMAEVSPDY